MKTVVSTLDGVPEALRGEYEEKDGRFVLKVEGEVAGYVPASELASANGRVVEFRDRNVELLKGVAKLAGVEQATDLTPLESLLEKYKGVDPEEFKSLKAEAEKLKKKGVNKSDDLDATIKAAVDAALHPVKEALESERKVRKQAQGQIDDATLRQAVGDRFVKVGGKPKAVDYMVGQAKDVFHVESGEVKAKPNRFSAKAPGEPLSIEEWLLSMVTEADFAFEPSKGGGSSGSTDRGGVPVGAKQLVDPTPQQLGQHMKEISKGEMVVVSSSKS